MKCSICGQGCRRTKLIHVVAHGVLKRARACLSCEGRSITVYIPDGEKLCDACGKRRADFCGECTQKRVRTVQADITKFRSQVVKQIRAIAKGYEACGTGGDNEDEANNVHHDGRVVGLHQAADILNAARLS